MQSLDSDILQAYLMGTISGTSVHSCLSDKVISDCKRQKIEAVGSEMSFRVSCKLPKKSSKFTNTKVRWSVNFPLLFMSSLCGVGVRVRVNNFSSKTTRPRDVLFFLKDTLSIEDEKLFKACKSVCSSVC